MALSMEFSLSRYDQKFWEEFIELYYSLPELWQPKHPKYKCQPLRERAYQILANKLKEVDPNAGTYLVRSKITSLRSYYRKEVGKIEKSFAKLQSYTPGWMFRALWFLKDSVNRYESVDPEARPIQIPKSPPFQTQIQIESTRSARPSQTQNNHRVPPNFTQNQHLSESEIDRIVTGWFFEFGKLPPDQKIFAKKAIYDILFEGQLCSLHKNSVTFNQPKPMVPPTLRHMSGGACFPRQPEIPNRNSTPEFQIPQHPVPIEQSIPPGPQGFQPSQPVPMERSIPPRLQGFQTSQPVPIQRSIPPGSQSFQPSRLMSTGLSISPRPQKDSQTLRPLPLKRNIPLGPQSFQPSQTVIMERNLTPGHEACTNRLVLIDQSIPSGPQKGFQNPRPVPMEHIPLGPQEDFQEEILGLPGIAEINIKMENIEKDPLETVILEL